ncbi:hypothetical protein GGS20DRAFT_567013 [Poronia punctata]|nr:hypothetical protein GGS20DRAFT_567013 [Poronia punctata]
MAVSTITARSVNGGRGRGRSFDTRPFYATLVFLTLLASYSFIKGGPSPSSMQQHHHGLHVRDELALSGEDCRLVHNAADKCAFVKRNCDDEKAGLIDYLTLYYCGLGSAQPLAFIILVSWLGLLFTTIGIAASDFFSVNLSTIATFLGLSESLAGVTFLAFGNGSPDVFSTFAAMSSNSGGMAVGELIGAAGFITSVVAGSMALVCEFKVARNTFVRDICFFIAAVAFSVGFLIDGQLYLAECLTMIAFYVFYVVVVVGWHTYTKRRNARRAKEAAARAHFYRTSIERHDEELEPYRDVPDEDDRSMAAGSMPIYADVSMLERAPLIEIGTAEANENDESDRNQHIAVEVASSMRVNRPRGRRSTTTITPIRPSLVGALEFRSVLASLQKEGNVPMRPIPTRGHSTLSAEFGAPRLAIQAPASQQISAANVNTAASASGTTRARAFSSGAVPDVVDSDLTTRHGRDGVAQSHAPHTIGGRLAPPPMGDRPRETTSPEPESSARETPPVLGRLRIPSPSGSDRSTLEESPFPRLTDSPMIMTPNTQQPSILNLPSPVEEIRSPFPGMPEPMEPKPVKWWPYKILPPPHVLLGTLFPTLQAWQSKSIWDKFVSVISVPTIFLLVITLPVVESETADDDSDEYSISQLRASSLPHLAPPVSVESNGAIEEENEWQRYRRSNRSRGSSRSASPNLISLDNPQRLSSLEPLPTAAQQPAMGVSRHDPSPNIDGDTSTIHSEDRGWNRWLLIVQIFTGPIFCVIIVWANMAEDLETPIKDLVRGVLGALVFSLVVLGILLSTTTPDHRPKYHVAFCFLGFVIAIAWISTVAGEVVGVMKTFGVILGISEAILGLTVFAVGNSIGDLVADVTVARLGYPVMALSACFGGPMLNILLGIGLGGAYQTVHAANKRQRKHPEKPYRNKPYRIPITGTLLVSAIALMMTLFALLVVLPMNKWMMTRKIGWGLIAFWLASTSVNLVIEMTGVWREIA